MRAYDVSAAILAGGAGRRMGTDKAMLPLRGRPLIQETADALRGRFAEAFIVGGRAYAFTGLPSYPDRVRGGGPLAGIAAALAVSSRETLFVVACDIPDLDFDLIDRLLSFPAGFDCSVPRVGADRYEPLFAVYRKSALPAVDAALASGCFGVHSLFSRLSAFYVDLPSGIRNLNTPEDVAAYLRGR